MIRHLLISILIFFLPIGNVFCQTTAKLSIAPLMGVGMSKITGVDEMIGNADIFSQYSKSTEYKEGYLGGVALKYHIPNSRFYLLAETSYSQRNSQFNLIHDASASIDDLSYQTPIKYQYWSAGAMVNFHFYRGFYIGVGGAFLLNTAKNQIFYQSNQNEKYNDAETQRTLRESFFGLNSFEWMGELGYVHKSGLGIGVRYRQSTSDMIETRENKYDYLEYKNTLEYISAQIYYWIPLMQ